MKETRVSNVPHRHERHPSRYSQLIPLSPFSIQELLYWLRNQQFGEDVDIYIEARSTLFSDRNVLTLCLQPPVLRILAGGGFLRRGLVRRSGHPYIRTLSGVRDRDSKAYLNVFLLFETCDFRCITISYALNMHLTDACDADISHQHITGDIARREANNVPPSCFENRLYEFENPGVIAHGSVFDPFRVVFPRVSDIAVAQPAAVSCYLIHHFLPCPHVRVCRPVEPLFGLTTSSRGTSVMPKIPGMSAWTLHE
ncbi:uncharacterized protein LAESUDRAFT_81662 [Laetiporus sulphureus 93-53]|uniref:Uncharacterized protein n=1 Tax=Laetiporus sulphureus 93-53 TaxID=1314785 RepID=A0A165F2C7_9APHY|nr:uncharacterized protein LAESUDRAFT_81662 [Laetiporus sulphureus 93-53]KZT08227.1 hypothetical protein LAESUDRAFT_81662 [Laetiporus sulphureus 93-53]